MGPESVKLIDGIASKLGITSEELIPYYASIFIHDGLPYIIFGAIVIIGTIACFLIIYDHAYKLSTEKDITIWVTSSVMVLAIGLILGGMIMCSGISNVTGAQGKAIEHIISLIQTNG